jgi:glutathione S-transferase
LLQDARASLKYASVRTLYHLWLSPFCRKVRVALREKGLDCELKVEKVWERRPEFLGMNAAGTVPVLVEDDGTSIADSGAICEYLEEVYPETKLIDGSPAERAETRRLLAWFDQKFAREVSDNLYREKIMKRFLRIGEPNSSAIRAGHQNVRYHLDYIAWLTERRRFLAGDRFSLADIAAAAHLSALDYLGDVPWDQHAGAKDWYARIKSRPSFRPLLADHIPGAPPPKHYADLDF